MTIGINDIIDTDLCGCDDCHSALRPAAYLADLMWYAKTYLVKRTDPERSIDQRHISEILGVTFGGQNRIKFITASNFNVTPQVGDYLRAEILEGGATRYHGFHKILHVQTNPFSQEFITETLDKGDYDLGFYAMASINKFASGGIRSFTELQELFCQNFCLDDDECEDSTNKICQYRIAIEVLSCYAEWMGEFVTPCQIEDFHKAAKNYLVNAYYTLLEQLGTSYFEVRDTANSNDPDQKGKLADKLGIILIYNILGSSSSSGSGGLQSLYTTDAIYLDPNANSGAKQITNQALEKIFGLRDYTRPACGCSGCNSNSPGDQPISLIDIWKKEFQRLQWIDQDSNKDIYSRATHDDPHFIIDPDLIGPDDFRYPFALQYNSSSSSSGNTGLNLRPYTIWESRRKFLDKIWNEIFYGADNWTEKGVRLSYSQIEIDEDIMAELKVCSKLRIIDSPGNNGIYSIAALNESEGVIIDLVETLNGNLSADAKIVIDVISSIIEFESGKIILNPLVSHVEDGDFVEVRGSSNNDGIYKVVSQEDLGGNTELTIDRTLNAITETANLISTKSYDIEGSGTIVKDQVKIYGQHDEYISADRKLIISGSTDNDGEYPVAQGGVAYDAGTDMTAIDLDKYLTSDKQSGKLTYSSKDFVGHFIVPHLGNRALVVWVNDLDKLISNSSSETIKVLRPGSSIAQEYTTLSSNAIAPEGSYSNVKVNEVVFGDEVDGRIIKTVSGTKSGNLLTVSGFTLAEIYDINDAERNKIEIGGTDYLLSDIENVPIGTPTDTEFTINDSSFLTIDDGPLDVNLFFFIKEVDTAGKGFTLPPILNPDYPLPDFVDAGDKLVISSVSPNINDGEYTIVSRIHEIAGDIIEVAEIVKDGTTFPNTSTLYFKKTLPIVFSYPKVDDIFNALTEPDFNITDFEYIPTPVTIANPKANNPWSFVFINLNNIISKRDQWLNALSEAEAEVIATQVKDDLNLDRDVFITLANIYEKHKLQLADGDSPRVTTDEYNELFHILILATKNAYAAWWFDEEKFSNTAYLPVKLNYADFWFSLTEPREAEAKLSDERYSPSSKAKCTPLIDPEVIGYGKLPDYTSGQEAIDIYNARKDQLNKIREVIKQTRLNYGFEQMLKVGLGGVNSTDDFPFNLSQQLQKLNSINLVLVQKAELDIREKLLVSVDDFRTIMQLRARVGTITPPTNDEYKKLYDLLTTAYKKRVLYPVWVKEEESFVIPDTLGYIDEFSNPYNFFNYWNLSKATLPKWRSSLSARRTWHDALVHRNRIPIVDPDLLFGEDFLRFNAPPTSLANTRRTTLANDYSDLNNSLVESAIVSALGISSFNEFDILQSMEEAGVDVGPRLRQFNLNYPAYKRIITLREVGLGNLLETERKELVNILIQALKLRIYYGNWNDVETDLLAQTNAISLSPYFFKLNKPAYGESEIQFYEKLDPWRATWKERRKWEKKLKARYEQREAVEEMLKTYIDETEKQVLPLIRDALVMFCGDEVLTLQENAKKLSDRLLVDFSMTCCQYTTRTAAAIDVMQKLIWTESIGINKNIKRGGFTLEFVLDADNFEEEWKWLGSYATWRAAMFVFMYPENLLLPSLKRHQSPAFIKLVNDVRGNNRLTPLAACRAAHEYSKYFEDITNLEVEATCCTVTHINKEKCLNRAPSFSQNTFYAFATGKKNHRAYWHTKTEPGTNMEDYSFWQPIEGLGSNIVKIIGASVYEIEEDIRHIYLFAIIHVELEDKLVFIKYDLMRQYWDGEYTELSLPEDVDLQNILVLQSWDEHRTPEIILKGKEYKAIYVNKLNPKGKDWQNDEWEMISPELINDQHAAKLHAYILVDPGANVNDRIIIASNWSNRFSYRLLGNNDDLVWRTVSDVLDMKFKGALVYDKGARVVIALFERSGVIKKYYIHLSTLNATLYRPISIFQQFSSRMKEACGYGLNDFPLEGEHPGLLRRFKSHVLHRIANTPPDKVYHEFYNDTVSYKFTPETIEKIFQAFQLFKDDNFTIPAFGIGITSPVPGKDYGDTRSEMEVINSWLTDDFMKTWNIPASKDLLWYNKMLETRYDQYWRSFYKDNETLSTSNSMDLKTAISSMLNWTAFDQPFGGQALWNGGNNSGRNQFSGKQHGLNPVFRLAKRNDVAVMEQSSFIVSRPYQFDYLRPNGGQLYPSTFAAKDFDNNSGNFAVKFILEGYLLDLVPVIDYRLNPYVTSYTDITEEVTSAELQIKKSTITDTVIDNLEPFDKPITHEYLREAWYYVPMFLGIQLSQRGHFKEALKWFKTVYDYSIETTSLVDKYGPGSVKTLLSFLTGTTKYYWAPANGDPWLEISQLEATYPFEVDDRRIYEGLLIDLDLATIGSDLVRKRNEWLLDPLNPHALALTRKYSFYKYTVSTIAQTLNSFGNDQFTLDTVETVSKATELYEFALKLLNLPIFRRKEDDCDALSLLNKDLRCTIVFDPDTTGDWDFNSPFVDDMFDDLFTNVPNMSGRMQLGEELKNIILANNGTPAFNLNENLFNADSFVGAISPPAGTTFRDTLEATELNIATINAFAMAIEDVELTANEVTNTIVNEVTAAVSTVTTYTPEQLSNPGLQIPWVQDPRKHYNIDVEDKFTQRAVHSDLIAPSGVTGFTVTANQDPVYAVGQLISYGTSFVPIIAHSCVPDNPTYKWLELSVELNLFKIRNCMNIAGMKRELDPYAAPTDSVTGLPTIGQGGQLVLPGTAAIRPTIYRYEFLIERAKQLVSIAQQLEAAFLSALEKRDAEYYNILKAKQDLALSKATVKLKDLQIKVAEGEVDLAILQKERSEIQVQELDNMINAGLNEFENQMIDAYTIVASLNATIAGLQFALGANEIAGGIIFGLATNAANKAQELGSYAILGGIKLGLEISREFVQAGISVNSILASQARREQEWNFQKTLATHDIKIGAQQVKISKDRVRVAGQDKIISELQVSNAEATIDFLNNKFTNADLYDWMSGVLENVYGYFLQEATGVAKVAQNQLAFERQELPPNFIQDDYWETPTDNLAISTPGANAPDRRGITGSTRLLQDIYKLDQYSFETEKRKLQISKTFSLATMAPMEFQLMKESGEITFDTLMEYFDRDFPGHYLRLIKKVKVSVIALIPPVEGIKATLISSGISHVVIGGNVFQDVIVRRSPEMVALSATRDASGVFDLQMQDPKLLNPFEGSGVHTRWQFKLPKASNMFDFNTIADILITVDYTALHSYDYEQQVNRRLANEFSADRAFSFRQEFADQFYELTHTEEAVTPMKVSLDLRKFDFPANVRDLSMDQLKFYFIADRTDPTENIFNDDPFSVKVTATSEDDNTPIVGTGGVNNNGFISTLTNGGTLTSLLGRSPVGSWIIDFTEDLTTVEDHFKKGKILDVIMVITYSGTLPPRS